MADARLGAVRGRPPCRPIEDSMETAMSGMKPGAKMQTTTRLSFPHSCLALNWAASLSVGLGGQIQEGFVSIPSSDTQAIGDSRSAGRWGSVAQHRGRVASDSPRSAPLPSPPAPDQRTRTCSPVRELSRVSQSVQ